MSTTALIAYREGTYSMLETCLASIARHTDMNDLELFILQDDKQQNDIQGLLEKYNCKYLRFPITDYRSGSAIHGALLNQAYSLASSEYLLSLDSDAFPISDNWLNVLIGKLENGATVSGILHPWQPIPSNVLKGNIDRRIRSKHCWLNTHVACQITKTSFIKDNKIDYCKEDDTGFMVPLLARQKGLKVEGLMPSKCGYVNKDIIFDLELNRHVCVIYGDLIYHHGGASQAINGYALDKDDMFSEVRKKVIESLGAEFLLQDAYSYKFDKEEEVADFKMQIMHQEMLEYLKTHESLF